jgi:hypothetical protein
MKLRSLFLAVAGAFFLTAAFIPRADAFVVSYFNFEDSGAIGSGIIDLVPDKTVAAGGNNAGGGIEPSTTNLTITTPGLQDVAAGLLINRTTSPPDQDTANPGLALNLSRSSRGSATISFSVNLQFYAGLSLSFATNNNGNGYANVTLSSTGAVVGTVGTQAMPLGSGIVTFALPSTYNGNGNVAKVVTFTLTFTNGQSNGQDLQTVIDNIRLDTTTIVPEPTTITGGLLGVLGLCWFQRRRLIRSVRWRRA